MSIRPAITLPFSSLFFVIFFIFDNTREDDDEHWRVRATEIDCEKGLVSVRTNHSRGVTIHSIALSLIEKNQLLKKPKFTLLTPLCFTERSLVLKKNKTNEKEAKMEITIVGPAARSHQLIHAVITPPPRWS